MGFAETVRLLDESEWAIGAGGGSAMHFSPLDDGQQLTAAETDGIGSVSLAVGELLSLVSRDGENTNRSHVVNIQGYRTLESEALIGSGRV